MRIAVGPGERERRSADPDAACAAAIAAEGRFPGFWLPQGTGFDALTVLSRVADLAPSLELGVAVIPVQFQHPSVLASHVLTTQAAAGNRLALGLGVGHRFLMDQRGLSFERPTTYMEEYLNVLLPLLAERSVDVTGERVSGHLTLDIPMTVSAPPVLLAALGPRMLKLAGTATDGTVVWLAGPRTVADHVTPRITAAAAAVGRPSPRIIVSLPICLTNDTEGAQSLADEAFGFYRELPSYWALLQREGVSSAVDVAMIGDESLLVAGLRHLAEAGATDFLARVFGTDSECSRTLDLLASL